MCTTDFHETILMSERKKTIPTLHNLSMMYSLLPNSWRRTLPTGGRQRAGKG